MKWYIGQRIVAIKDHSQGDFKLLCRHACPRDAVLFWIEGAFATKSHLFADGNLVEDAVVDLLFQLSG